VTELEKHRRSNGDLQDSVDRLSDEISGVAGVLEEIRDLLKAARNKLEAESD
jgi:hypothetical protein